MAQQGIYDWQHDFIKQLYPWLFQTPISQTPEGSQYWSAPTGGYGMPDFMSMTKRGGGDMPSWLDEMAKLTTSPRLGQAMQQAGQGDVGGQLRGSLWDLIMNPRQNMGGVWDMLSYLMPDAMPPQEGMSDYEIEQMLQTMF